jgi:hypothetical protein
VDSRACFATVTSVGSTAGRFGIMSGKGRKAKQIPTLDFRLLDAITRTLGGTAALEMARSSSAFRSQVDYSRAL